MERDPDDAGAAEKGNNSAASCELSSCAWLSGEGACQDVRKPAIGAPFAEDSDDSVPSFYLAVAEMWLQPRTDGDQSLPIGFNVDGACTGAIGCGETPTSPSCKQAYDRPDSRYCVDNTLGELLLASEEVSQMEESFSTNPEVVNCGLYHGDYSQLLRLSDYNGTENDPQVRLDLYSSPGLEKPITDWECPAADRQQRLKMDTWGAESRFLVSELDVSESTDPADGLPPSSRATDNAYVQDGFLVASLPGSLEWGFHGRSPRDAGWVVKGHQWLLVGRLAKGEDGYRLESGVMTGRSTVEDTFQAFRRAGYCLNMGGADPAYELLTEAIEDNLDVLADGDTDPQRACDAVSYAFAFRALPAVAGKVFPQDSLPDCCLIENQNNAACMPPCGDGLVQDGERCDTAIAAGDPGACPTSCPQEDACKPQRLVGSACTSYCVATAISQLADGDGCCPPGASASRDDDCDARCGNGSIDPLETCDPPESCRSPDGCVSEDACVLAQWKGGASTCDARCEFRKVTSCTSDDGCCPAECDAEADNDCAEAPTCGNGEIDGGEFCDGDCPSECASEGGDACARVTLVGSAANCTARCAAVPINGCNDDDGCCNENECNATNDNDCQPVCGNGVIEGDEACDDGDDDPRDGCDQCRVVTDADRCNAGFPMWGAGLSAECSACMCERCPQPVNNCADGNNDERSRLCAALLGCAERTGCRGRDCLCQRLSCYVSLFDGPCAAEVRAASAVEPLGFGILLTPGQPGYPINLAETATACVDSQCAAECGR